MKKILVMAIFVTITFILFPLKIIQAHSGRTDPFGCHNCYTSYCYGEYHCHNGGSGGYMPAAPQYLLPAPTNPNNGFWTYEISDGNWCNYDLNISWDKPTYGDRFSIAASKYAGANPGPIADTYSLNYVIKNLSPGRWYINIKTGNSERWSQVSYWTLDIPKPTPSFTAFIEKQGYDQFLNYQISCMDRVEGPNEFINFLKSNNNLPKGKVSISYPTTTTISMKGWDKSNKEYAQTLTYVPIVKENIQDTNIENEGQGFAVGVIFASGVFFFGWLVLKVILKIIR